MKKREWIQIQIRDMESSYLEAVDEVARAIAELDLFGLARVQGDLHTDFDNEYRQLLAVKATAEAEATMLRMRLATAYSIYYQLGEEEEE